ncbi:MAG TPA: hypothetical protein VMZ52_09940 [Bryobacteraceae bacterium]|nr:hypothetical protein [Bryobacteraceae bacterium]
MQRLLLLFFLVFTLSGAEKRTTMSSAGSDEILALDATLMVDREVVRQALGRDPGMNLVVVQVKLAPRADNKVKIWLDDFTLLSSKDGEKSQPMAPSQIAGKGAMIVSRSEGSRPRVGFGNGGQNGPIWGGAPGTGSRPRRIGGDDDVSSAGSPGEVKATTKTAEGEEENPLLAVLRAKILPEVETNEAVSGLLYFVFEGKQKLKDMTLLYKSPAGRMILEFKK